MRKVCSFYSTLICGKSGTKLIYELLGPIEEGRKKERKDGTTNLYHWQSKNSPHPENSHTVCSAQRNIPS